MNHLIIEPVFQGMLADWVYRNTYVEPLRKGEVLEVTTPFLDRHNDYVQIYLDRSKEEIRISDGGSTVSELISSGCDVRRGNRAAILNSILNGFGVTLDEDELWVRAKQDDCPEKCFMLIQAVLAVGDLSMTSRHKNASIFLEDVARFLGENRIRHTPDVHLKGLSGLPHHFDFVIPGSPSAPERLLKVIPKPNAESMRNTLFALTDTVDTRPANSQILAMLDDSQKKVSKAIENGFKKYGVKPLLWSQREEFKQGLAA